MSVVPRADERVVDVAFVVAQRARHALNGLLGAVVGDDIVARAGCPMDRRDVQTVDCLRSPIQWRSPPCGPRTRPVRAASDMHPAEDQRRFGPYDLARMSKPADARLAATRQRAGRRARRRRRHRAAGPSPRSNRPVVVGDLALAIGRARDELAAPRRVVLDAIGGSVTVRSGARRPGRGQRHRGSWRPAEQAVLTECPQFTWLM